MVSNTTRKRLLVGTVRMTPVAPSTLDFSGKLIKGQVARLSFCNCASILARSFSLFGKARADSAGEQKSLRTLVADEQGAKVFLIPFWERITADDEFLRLREEGFAGLTRRPFSQAEFKITDKQKRFFSPYWGGSLSGWALPCIVLI